METITQSNTARLVLVAASLLASAACAGDRTQRGSAPPSTRPATVQPAANGIAFPTDYQDWRVINASHRTDKNSMRIIVGNDIAIAAARSGQTNPWPDSAILAKVVFKETASEDWAQAIVPGELVHVEIMVKNQAAYPATGGWGFARWLGPELKPHSDDPSFVDNCFGCHTPVADTDYVFTQPVRLP